jgi:hypothetical protein
MLAAAIGALSAAQTSIRGVEERATTVAGVEIRVAVLKIMDTRKLSRT